MRDDVRDALEQAGNRGYGHAGEFRDFCDCQRFTFEQFKVSKQSGFHMVGANPTLEPVLEDLYQCDQSDQDADLFVYLQWNLWC